MPADRLARISCLTMLLNQTTVCWSYAGQTKPTDDLETSCFALHNARVRSLAETVARRGLEGSGGAEGISSFLLPMVIGHESGMPFAVIHHEELPHSTATAPPTDLSHR